MFYIFAQEISDFFIVDFKVGSMNQILDIFGHLNSFKYVVERSVTKEDNVRPLTQTSELILKVLNF